MRNYESITNQFRNNKFSSNIFNLITFAIQNFTNNLKE